MEGVFAGLWIDCVEKDTYLFCMLTKFSSLDESGYFCLLVGEVWVEGSLQAGG